jgi:hypothetical protein
MSDTKTYTFQADDIFSEIPGDPDNVNMKIPDEIAEAIGVKPGDTVRVLWGDQGTVVIQKIEEKDEDVQAG